MSASDRAAGAGVDIDAVLAASSAFPVGIKPPYGTGGFRAEGSQLESTLFRSGALAMPALGMHPRVPTLLREPLLRRDVQVRVDRSGAGHVNEEEDRSHGHCVAQPGARQRREADRS